MMFAHGLVVATVSPLCPTTELAWLRRNIHGYRVRAAHLSQRVNVTAGADGLCRIGAEQRERVLAAQFVPLIEAEPGKGLFVTEHGPQKS